MTHPEPRSAQTAMAAAIALAGLSCVFAPGVAAADPAAPKSAAECRAIADFTQRGQCWDALDREGLHDEQVVKKRDFGLGVAPPDAAAVVAPKPKKEAAAKRGKPENGEIRELTLTIASVTLAPQGRVVLTSTDGAVWEQTDSDKVENIPAPGETFKVSKGAMGGFMCHLTRWQTVRCQRDQ
jgi:hypothetical protein